MANYRLLNTDHFLELSPRWHEAVGFLDLSGWLLLGIVPLVLVIWLYRYELKLVGGFAARMLLGLRLLVVALLFFLVFWQPRLGAQVHDTAADRVLVIVDRSGSMDVSDPQRPPLEKLKLARALKLCTDLVTDAQLDQWIGDGTDGREPKWLSDEEANEPPDTRRRLEEDRRALHEKVLKKVDGFTRTQLIQHLLDKDGGHLLPDLTGRFQVQLLGFAGSVSELPPEQIEDLFQETMEGGYTDFKPIMERALERVVGGSGTVRGVILLTDGRQNRGDRPFDEAERLGQQKAPLFPVVVGASDPRPGITVAHLDAPTTLLKDPEDAKNLNAVVRASIRVRATEAQKLVVELLDDKADKDQAPPRKTLNHPGGDQDYEVVFPTALSAEGTHKLTIRVRPEKPMPGGIGLERSAQTHVIKDQAEVLVIDGEARWEYHYLTVALGRDKLVKEVRGVVFDQPRIGKVSEGDLEKNNWPALKLPKEAAALTGYDCIVLGDVPPDKLPLKDRERLQSYVRDAGGTLVIVAGKRSMPMNYPKDSAHDPNRTDPIAAMLPITSPRIIQSREGFHVTLTDDGRLNALLQLSDKKADDAEARPDRDIWAELPPHYWAVVGKKKPAATTLAYYPGEPGDGAKQPPKKADQEANSLIAWQTYGRGRVLYVGLDSTWRWRYKVGDQHHHRFWGQLVRWATADKLLPGGEGKVRFGTPRPNYKTGEEIDVRLRLDKSLPEPAPETAVVARIMRIVGDRSARVSAVALRPRAGQPRTLEGRLRDLPAGTYKIELDFTSLGAKLGPDFDAQATNRQAAEFVITTPEDEEMTNLTTDLSFLQNLADKNGAKTVYTLDTAHSILDKLTRQDEGKAQPPPAKPLWEWWPTLVLLVSLLTVEWVGRKWAGLP